MIQETSLKALFMSVFLLVGGLSACCEPLADDNYEPNDYPEQAYPIGFAYPIEARVSEQSKDFYSVIVGEPTDLWVLVTLDASVFDATVGIMAPGGIRHQVSNEGGACHALSGECPEEAYSSYDWDGRLYELYLPVKVPGEYIISVATHNTPYCVPFYACGESTPYTLLLSQQEPETEQ